MLSWTTQAATEYDEAMGLLDSCQYDILIADNRLDDGKLGTKLCGYAKAVQASITTVIISGYDISDETKNQYSDVVDFWFNKSVGPNKIVEALRLL
jgi:DNA-binding NtrC family response regulator